MATKLQIILIFKRCLKIYFVKISSINYFVFFLNLFIFAENHGIMFFLYDVILLGGKYHECKILPMICFY